MMVRAKKKAPAHKGENPTPKPLSTPYTFVAPIRGWVLNENLATAGPGAARVLDNWVCTTSGIRVRGGRNKYATLDNPVTSLMTYQSGAVSKFFAATEDSIFDISTVVDPDVAPTADVTGQTSGYYSSVQFGTAGGDFLVIANGTDDLLNYDGTTFSAPTITGLTSSEISHVWSFASRIFFVKKDSTSAYYLPVDSISGAVAEFSLAGVFSLGGSLLFGAKWSLDAGDGLDDKCVFVSTEGEVAVFEGTNPSSAADWRKVGLYAIPKPLGRRPYMQAGGDLLIATQSGLIAISDAVNKDIAALDASAVSRAITPYWQEKAGDLSTKDWEMVKIPQANIMVVSQPDADNPTCLVCNLQTGAWSRFTGWDTQCLALYSDRGYFGSADSCVYLMESGGSDNGDTYTAAYLGQHEQMGAQGRQKTILQMRPIFLAGSPVRPMISAQTDYGETLSPPPSSVDDFSAATWDSAVWDIDVWDGDVSLSVGGTWTAIGKTGFSIAPELQITYGVTPTPRVELVSIDAEFIVGAMVA